LGIPNPLCSEPVILLTVLPESTSASIPPIGDKIPSCSTPNDLVTPIYVLNSLQPSPRLLNSLICPLGYREPEEGESSLSAALDSLIPFIIDDYSSVNLPVFWGKSTLFEDPVSGEVGCSKMASEKAGKEYAWSRRLGVETSPIKARSSRKKSSLSTVTPSGQISFIDGGALRALKALARKK
jgi:hypothetical protein